MARGWESKAVEDQQAAASQKSSPGLKLNAAEAANLREKENLRLSRQSVLQQLKASSNPRLSQLLQKTLAALDEKMSELEKHTVAPRRR